MTHALLRTCFAYAASAAILSATALLSGCHTAQTTNAPILIAHQTEADKAWDDLRAGNARYVSGRLEHPNQSVQRRQQVAAGQHPRAVVLACSDSRVPPEILFDTGLGDLFVVRVAGNTADPATVGSIEYAVDHLHVPLIIVLGHQHCGAVEAAVKSTDHPQPSPGQIDAIISPITPSVAIAKTEPGDIVENTMRENVIRVTRQLSVSQPILSLALHDQKLKIIGCRYDLDSGMVSEIDQTHSTSARP